MAKKTEEETRKTSTPASTKSRATGPQKPCRRNAMIRLSKPIWDGLYPAYYYLDKNVRLGLGLMMKIPVFIVDPMVALENPALGVQEIELRIEKDMGDGPTSSRVAVVDFNADTQKLTESVVWDETECWFRTPLSEDDWLPDAPEEIKGIGDADKDLGKYKEQYEQFIKKTVKDPYFHQVNAWAVVHRVLELYEAPWALGRPVPWGFDGNRLIIVPHAGYGENAFYDRYSKSLQFYYFGDQHSPCYTCLSHDIIAHETGHAVLDGIRPMYNQPSSIQTLAFHEFTADLTAILLSLFNQDIRRFVAETTTKGWEKAGVIANIGEQFARHVEGRPYLRTAFNELSLKDEEIKCSLSPHHVSQVMTGAMWDILRGIDKKHLAKNLPAEEDPDAESAELGRKVTPAQALWWAADRFRRVALQPLDLCPPCDIQFIDYAKAVIRNDILTNPADEQGYRPMMLEIFHKRGLCDCGYENNKKKGKEKDEEKTKKLPKACRFQDVMKVESPNFVYYNIERLASSRTLAYHFLHDNRRVLHIPPHHDIRVVDLYDNSKYYVGTERLPRQIILEYAWQEAVPLANDTKEKLDFGNWKDKIFDLDCGGTLVFDENGNLLSWFRKPGTEHITDAEAAKISGKIEHNKEVTKKAAKEVAKKAAKKGDEEKLKRITKQEQADWDDRQIGRERKTALKDYLEKMIRRGLVGTPQPENRFSDALKPVMAIEDGKAIRFEIAPSLKDRDFDVKEAEWVINY